MVMLSLLSILTPDMIHGQRLTIILSSTTGSSNTLDNRNIETRFFQKNLVSQQKKRVDQTIMSGRLCIDFEIGILLRLTDLFSQAEIHFTQST